MADLNARGHAWLADAILGWMRSERRVTSARLVEREHPDIAEHLPAA